MVKKKNKGLHFNAVINFGKFGQDLNTYRNTNLSENMTYSLSKVALILLQSRWDLIMAVIT